MIDVNNLDIETDRARYMLALAEQFAGNEETTVGPTDSAIISEALRLCAARRDANG